MENIDAFNFYGKQTTRFKWVDTEAPLIKVYIYKNFHLVLFHKGEYSYDTRADYTYTLKIYLIGTEYKSLQEFKSCYITDCENNAIKFIDKLREMFKNENQ